MMCQSFLEEFVGQDAGLRQSIHSFADLHVNTAITIKDFLSKLIMINYVIGYKCNRYLHVFNLIKGCLEVHVFDVGTGKACVFGAVDTIP
jgi:hypothetical protein